jgi:hypothetical protein
VRHFPEIYDVFPLRVGAFADSICCVPRGLRTGV